MKKITLPHVHKIVGDAGFFAKITKKGEIKDLKIQVLEGLRQIEGILIGRKVEEVPVVVSRICGICPVVHTLNTCRALEKILKIKPSLQTTLLRKLLLCSQIIQSHTLHLFFLTLPDFLDIKKESDLLKRFKKEAKATLKIRDFSLSIIKLIGGRTVHPISSQIGKIPKIPKREELKKILKEWEKVFEETLYLMEIFKKIEYPSLKRKTIFTSLYLSKNYPYYEGKFIKAGGKKSSVAHFYSNEIEENFKEFPVKRVKYKGKTYMLGALARLKNNKQNLSSFAKKFLESFLKERKLKEKDFFENVFYNNFAQAVEILHFLEELRDLILEILEKVSFKEEKVKIFLQKGSALSAMEAPRGTLFTYFETNKEGRIINCNIITPTAQFLNNLEEDIKAFLSFHKKLSKKEKIEKVKSLIRVYDPCISCAVH